jgi:hypothetical protein
MTRRGRDRIENPTATEELEWWETWRAALRACMPVHEFGPLPSAICLDAGDGGTVGERDAEGQLYAMQCAAVIASTAHGFTPETYVGPR